MVRLFSEVYCANSNVWGQISGRIRGAWISGGFFESEWEWKNISIGILCEIGENGVSRWGGQSFLSIFFDSRPLCCVTKMQLSHLLPLFVYCIYINIKWINKYKYSYSNHIPSEQKKPFGCIKQHWEIKSKYSIHLKIENSLIKV